MNQKSGAHSDAGPAFSRRGLLLTTLAATAVGALPAWSQQNELPASIPARLDEYLTRVSGFGYSGATLVVKDGAVLLRKGYGMANDADRFPVTPDTIFDPGSHAKTFTAAAMMRLVVQGRVALSDPIGRFLPDAPQDKRTITIEQLLSHTAGLDRDFPVIAPSAEYEEVSRTEALRRIFATELIDTPGNDYSYSNLGFILAAAIVETAAQQPFRDFVRSEILTPLGLSNTGFWGALPPAPDERLARSYNVDGTQTANLRVRSGTTWADLGGGQMVTTIDDLYAWMTAMRGDAFLPAELRDRMWTPVKGPYGLGWFIDEGPGGRRIHHGGDIAGFGSELAWYPEHNLVLANLANRRNDELGTRYAADRMIPLLVLNQPPRLFAYQTPFDLPPRWTPGRTSRLDAMTGLYRLASGAELTVRKLANGDYRISAVGQDAIDAIMPASPEARALRAGDTQRAIALMRDAIAGDEAAMTPTLREGAPVSNYRRNLGAYASDAEQGNLVAIEPIGTALWDYPVSSRLTSLKLRYERGETYLRFGWDSAQDRVMYWGLEGPESFGLIPLRSSRTSGVVGWSMITGRSLKLRLRGRNRLEIEHSDGARVEAVRSA